MQTDILMPRLSDTMEEGVISAWRKQVGDEIHAGDVIVEVETDKAIMEHEAYEDGVLSEIVVAEGESAPIGVPIARLAGVGESVAAPAASAPETATPPEPQRASVPVDDAQADAPANGDVSRETTAASAEHVQQERVASSPLARRDARELGIDLSAVTGTGPGGRVIRADVHQMAAQSKGEAIEPAPPAAAPAVKAAKPSLDETDERIALTSVRKTIARRLTESKRDAPHIYLTKSIDAGSLMELREGLNGRLVSAGRAKVSVNDIIIRAAALVLRDHPVVNSSFTDDAIVQHRRINVGMAVATDAGLLVPVINDADTKSVTTIGAESRDLAGRARERKLSIDEMSGGTFTVSNLGMFGIEHFTAVINPPESAILAVGAVRQEPGVRNGEVAVVQKMSMTLSADHRVIDGVAAAEYVRDLAALLEDPWLALA